MHETYMHNMHCTLACTMFWSLLCCMAALAQSTYTHTHTHTHTHHRYIEDYAPAPIDDSQDITNASASFANGFTTMRFTRPLTASNPRDLSLTECRFFLFGWGGPATVSTRGIQYHPSTPIISTNRICLLTPQECGKLSAIISVLFHTMS